MKSTSWLRIIVTFTRFWSRISLYLSFRWYKYHGNRVCLSLECIKCYFGYGLPYKHQIMLTKDHFYEKLDDPPLRYGFSWTAFIYKINKRNIASRSERLLKIIQTWKKRLTWWATHLSRVCWGVRWDHFSYFLIKICSNLAKISNFDAQIFWFSFQKNTIWNSEDFLFRSFFFKFLKNIN